MSIEVVIGKIKLKSWLAIEIDMNVIFKNKPFPLGIYKHVPLLLFIGVLLASVAVLIPSDKAIGLIALVFFGLCLLFFAFFQPYPELRRVIILGFVLRALLALVHAFWFPLYGSGADAVRFERVAWELAEAWRSGQPFELITGTYFYSFIIGIFYYILGRCPLLMQGINVFLGALIVYNVGAITRAIFDSRKGVIAAWITCLFPTLILFSAITLREIMLVFCFSLAVLFFVHWQMCNNNTVLLKSVFWLFISGLFHAGITVLLMVPFVFWLKLLGKDFWRVKSVSLISGVIIGLILLFIISIPLNQGIGLEKIPDIESLDKAEYYGEQHNVQSRSRAQYLNELTLLSPKDLLYAVPIKTIYFLFAPFPWQITAAIDVIGVADGLFYLLLFVLSFKGLRQKCWSTDKELFWGLFLFILIGVVVFAMGTGNYGTALRHRAKFVFLFIIMASPELDNIWRRLITRKRIVTSVREGS